MVNPKIGISNGAPAASSYDAVDLLEEPSASSKKFAKQKEATAATDTKQYTIDSDEDSGDEDGSSEDDDEDSSDDEDESSDDSDDDDDDDDDTKSDRNDSNSTAVTEVMSNLLRNPPAKHHTSPARGMSNTPNKKRSIIPPASTFKNLGRKFPSYMLKGGKRAGGRDKLGKHQKLSTTDEDEEQDHEDDVESNSKKVLMNKPINKVRDPSQFPIEQYTDKKFGAQQDFGSYSYSTSYSSADPSSVDYEPQSLRRMPVDLSNGVEEKKRKIVFFGFLTAIGICVIIAISSIIAHAKRHHVVPPPNTLENLCDISNIATKQGHQLCESVCEEAKCCMAPGINSCFEGQEKVCSMYSPCAALYSTNSDSDMHVMVPPAPENLPQLCSNDSIMFVSGYIECNAACQAGQCCTLADIDDYASLAAPGLVDLSDLPKSCVQSHPDLCAGYKPCDALKGLMDAHGTPSDLVNSKCTAAKMQTELGIDECESACQPRACCFAHSKKRNCYDDNKTWCDKFQACKILTGEEIEPSNEEEDDDQGKSVTEKCSKDSRELSANELSMCKMICNPVSCCFYEDVGCTRDIDCEFYSFCSTLLTSEFPSSGDLDGFLDFTPGDENIDEILPPSGGQHTPGPSQKEVQDACDALNSRSVVSFHPMHQMKCGQLCANYMCCFDDDFDPASCHEETTCQKYTSCQNLIVKDENKDACSVSNLLKPDGFNQCEGICSDHMCCFFSGGCQNSPKHNCKQHEQCRILSSGMLLGTDIHGKSVFDFVAACSKEVVYGENEDKDLCAAICEEHKCCWDDSIDCPAGHNCSNYKPCEILKEGNDEYYYYYYDGDDEKDGGSLTNLNAVCKKELVISKDAYFGKSCVDICEDAKCCYDGTCDYTTNFCAMRTACSSVSIPSLACSGDLTKGVGVDACQNACNIFNCCWEEKGCYSTHETECLAAMKHCNYISR